MGDIAEKYRLTLGEGFTPLSNEIIDGIDVTFKHEQTNPNGSFKDRSLAYQLSHYLSEGKRSFVISSSGNAAISAAAYARLKGLELTVFVAEKINRQKLAKLESLQNKQIKLIKSKQPKSDAIKFAGANAVVNLRGSVDEHAVMGFKTVAYELLDKFPSLDSVFVACSSGTSATGIALGFKEANRTDVQLHICQTGYIHPIAKEFDTNFKEEEDSMADAIVDRVARRKNKLIELVKASGGSGWVITDTGLRLAHEAANQKGSLKGMSYNSLLPLAGLRKALVSGFNLKNPVVILSGT